MDAATPPGQKAADFAHVPRDLEGPHSSSKSWECCPCNLTLNIVSCFCVRGAVGFAQSNDTAHCMTSTASRRSTKSILVTPSSFLHPGGRDGRFVHTLLARWRSCPSGIKYRGGCAVARRSLHMRLSWCGHSDGVANDSRVLFHWRADTSSHV